MMQRLGLGIGIVLFWLAWPVYQLYYRLHERTRVLLVAGNELLLLKGWISDGKWNLAGGGVHWGEAPLAGAIREVAEETGLKLLPAQLQFLGKQTYRAKGLHFTYNMFFVAADKSQPLKRQRHEIAGMRWVLIPGLSPRTVSQEVFGCLAAARSRHLLQ